MSIFRGRKNYPMIQSTIICEFFRDAERMFAAALDASYQSGSRHASGVFETGTSAQTFQIDGLLFPLAPNPVFSQKQKRRASQ